MSYNNNGSLFCCKSLKSTCQRIYTCLFSCCKSPALINSQNKDEDYDENEIAAGMLMAIFLGMYMNDGDLGRLKAKKTEEDSEVEEQSPIIIQEEQPKPLLQIIRREIQIPEIQIPAFNIKAGSISREGNKYKITDKKTLSEHTFIIQGRKNIIFASSPEEYHSVNYGVIIESNFYLNNQTYSHMLVQMNSDASMKSTIVILFFENIDICFKKICIRKKEELIKEEFPCEYIYNIPLEIIVESTNDKPIETYEDSDKPSYINGTNKLKFIDTFARKCKISLSEEFKKALLKNIINTFFERPEIRGDEISKLEIDVEKYWEQYTKTESKRVTLDK